MGTARVGGILYGGGIGCNDSITTISNCTIRGNVAFWGGGIDCYRSCIIIKDCSISGNEANGFFYQGDGVRCYDNSNSKTLKKDTLFLYRITNFFKNFKLLNKEVG